ncbi:hypothetical protein BDW22DRAFT_1417597 [Trametopsis cervina]|nr:hypothetical protein BDW22DRAFT_1417597 [Trametopsis cervina]
MWTFVGPFDGKVAGEMNVKKVKLVKPGRQYTVGRKDCDLVVNHKREDPDARPSLELRNITANRQLFRGEERVTVNAESSIILQSGDEIEVLHDVRILVKWESVVCYCAPSQEAVIPSADECAELGLKVLWKPHHSVTHHVTAELNLDPAIATSLVGLTKFVRPDWLRTVVERGMSSDPSISLEHEFVLPSASQFRPILSPYLPSSLKNHRSWEPNEGRVSLLEPYRFIFVGERGHETTLEHTELVKRGGGTYECCAVQGGRKVLHRALAKGKEMKKELVLITNSEAMVAAVGTEEWEQLVNEAAEYELQFVTAIRLTEAVTHVDLSYIDCKLSRSVTATSGSILPDVVLNTHPSEPTIPRPAVTLDEAVEASAPRRKLVRRAASRASSRAPSVPPEEPKQTVGSSTVSSVPPTGETGAEESSAPRKRLVRRAGVAKPTILGIDDPSIIEDAPAEASTGPTFSASVDPTPAPTSRPNRLKRRLGVTQPPESQLFAAIDASLAEVEPPHKKYKALFDESDPDRIVQSGGSLTQPPETPSLSPLTQGASRQVSTSLPVVAEEEEESVVPSGAVSHTFQSPQNPQLKRKTRLDVDGDTDMPGGELDEDARPRKRRHTNSESQAVTQSQVAPKPSSSRPFTSTQTNDDESRHTGSAPGKPDRDEAFLKAVASTKKGKRLEDSFDREFNNLRISKPDLEQQQAKDDWAVLDNFENDNDLRGNFMVVVEIEIYKRGESNRNVVRTAGSRTDWEGRPDFKKFKKKAAGERRKPIELVVEDDDELSLTQNNWKASHTQSSQPPDGSSHRPRHELAQRRTNLIMDSDDDLTPVKPGSKSRARPQTATQPEPRAKTSRQQQKAAVTQQKGEPLFMDSDEGEGATGEKKSLASSQVDEEDSESESTLPTTGRRTQPTRANTKRGVRALILDEDSDDGATFKGFGARKRTRR